MTLKMKQGEYNNFINIFTLHIYNYTDQNRY